MEPKKTGNIFRPSHSENKQSIHHCEMIPDGDNSSSEDNHSIDLSSINRVTIVDSDHGLCFEKRNLYENGCFLLIQDDGRTLKIFPRKPD